jgi:serine/threonine protein phosphatase PrpC
MKNQQNVTDFNIVADGVGGYHASYGYGVANTDYDYATMGYGASYAEAMEDALTQLVEEVDISLESEQALEEGFEKEMKTLGQDPTCESEVGEAVQEAYEEMLRDLGRTPTEAEEEQMAEESMGSGFEVGVVVYVKTGAVK